jgi:hypothetical protein
MQYQRCNAMIKNNKTTNKTFNFWLESNIKILNSECMNLLTCKFFAHISI